jgi:oligopeptide transport system substrate-binding protein
MVKHNDGLKVSRRDFLKTAGALGLLAAAGSSIPLTVFSTGCAKGGQPAATQVSNQNLAGEPNTIDPNLSSWASSRSVLSQVFDGLLGFDKNLALIAVVAKEIPTVANNGISADGKTYTFNLKTNVTWSDGTKVKAQDFEYSIRRLFDPDNPADYASMYYVIAGAEAYNGAADKDAATKATLKAAVGVTSVNDTTLKITLVNPQPTFLQLAALWPIYPIREDIVTAKGAQWIEAGNYIGNGPFTMTEWVHQDHMTFEIDPNYWGTRKSKLSKVTYKMITDANAALAAYKNQELDMSGVPVGTEKATMADSTLSPQIVRNADLTTFAFEFNTKKAPLDNITVRQGLSCAVDRASFIDKVRGGVGKVALSWVPPGMPGYDENLGKEWDFNVTKAKSLLSQAGYPDPSKLSLKFTYADTASNGTIAQFLQGQMSTNLGINLTLEPMEASAFQAYVNAENHQWAWFGWGADYPDPENFLQTVFSTGGGNNHTAYSNPQFDALAVAAASELDNTKRLKDWADAAAIIANDCPFVTMFYRERFLLVQPYFKGLTPTGMDGQIMGDQFWTNCTIEK